LLFLRRLKQMKQKALTPDFFSGLKQPVEFFIIRHGQSEGNAARLMQGRLEFPLSETGRLQAAARGQSLKALSETSSGKILVFSSPQSRAKESAQIITREAALPEAVYLDELMEMKLGVWAGKKIDALESDEPALWADFMAHSWDVIPEAESSGEMYDRALRAWTFMRDAAIKSAAEKVITVTHGGLIQWLLKTSLQCRSWYPLFPIGNCALFKLCVKPHPTEPCAYLYWEEINSLLPNQEAEPKGALS